MKGLILTAGNGTRLRPLSYTKPKPLLPVANQPVISYGIDRLYELGIRDIGLVIQPEQEDLFKEYLPLAQQKNIQISYIPQHEQKGISHAVRQAEDFIGSDSFVLLLGDNLITEPLDLLRDSFNENGIHGTVMVTEVSKPEDYGIAEIKNNKIINVEEKPDNPKSNLAVIGAYIFDPTIFKAIQSIFPSARGEYEITDAIQWMINHDHPINYVKTKRPIFDVGTVDRWLEANQWLLKQHADSITNKFESSIIIPPVKIGDNCDIKDSIIGPHVSIEPNTKIHKCTIENSIVLRNSHLNNVPYTITNSVFGEKTDLIGRKLKDNKVHGVFGDESKLFISHPSPQNKGNSE